MTAHLDLPVSWQEFEQFFLRPENTERLYEYINGEIVEVALDSTASIIGANVSTYLSKHVKQHKLGYVTGANGGYRFDNDALLPSCAFIPKDRRPTPTDEYYPALTPALVVEVKARDETYLSLLTKIVIYLKHGVNIVWLVMPEKRHVEVFTDSGIELAELTDTLDGGTVLPDFTLNVNDIFANVE
jgi:Uma2 family endonuclease